MQGGFGDRFILIKSQGKSVGELVTIFSVSCKTIYNWFEGWNTPIWLACTTNRDEEVNPALPVNSKSRFVNGAKSIPASQTGARKDSSAV